MKIIITVNMFLAVAHAFFATRGEFDIESAFLSIFCFFIILTLRSYEK